MTYYIFINLIINEVTFYLNLVYSIIAKLR